MEKIKSSHYRKPRLCQECGHIRTPKTRSLCRNCYERQRRKKLKKRTCKKCHKLKKLKGQGLCDCCYKKVYPSKPRKCAKCQKTSVIKGHNLCPACYQSPERKCKECLLVLPHYGRGYCRSCYNRWLRGRERICNKCQEKRLDAGKGRCIRCIRLYGPVPFEPKPSQVHRVGACVCCGNHGRIYARNHCQKCYYETISPFDFFGKKLRISNRVWAERLISRFHRHLKLRGYSGYRTYTFCQKLVQLINDEQAKHQSGFCKNISRRFHDTLMFAGHLTTVEEVISKFFKDTRLTYGIDLSVSGYLGRCFALIENSPKPLRPELKFYYDLRRDELSYRKQTGEKSASEKTIYGTIYLLCGWASWMNAKGIFSWGQFNIAQFRQRIQEMGLVGINSEIRIHLCFLRRMFTELKTHGRILFNPFKRIQTPRVETVQYSISNKTLRGWFITLNDPVLDTTVRSVGYLLLLHGLTHKEMAGLLLANFDIRMRTLYIRKRKVKISLDPLTFEAIRGYVRCRPKSKNNSHFFVNKHTRLRETPASLNFFNKKLKSIGMLTKPVRQMLIRQMVEDYGVEITARYFSLSVDTVNNHVCHQSILLQEENQVHTKYIQDHV